MTPGDPFAGRSTGLSVRSAMTCWPSESSAPSHSHRGTRRRQRQRAGARSTSAGGPYAVAAAVLLPVHGISGYLAVTSGFDALFPGESAPNGLPAASLDRRTIRRGRRYPCWWVDRDHPVSPPHQCL